MFDGALIVGAIVSFNPTVTANDLDAVFPALSVAVQVTVAVPIGNWEPEEGLHDTGTFTPLSVAVTENVTLVPLEEVDSRNMFDGALIVGAIISTTSI